MTTLIICIVVGALLGVVVGWEEEDGPLGLHWVFPGAFWGAVVGFIIALVVGLIAYTGTHWEQTQRTPLISVADGSTVHGSFFLGSGSIDGSPSFTWYERHGENSYVREQTDSEYATIHYIEKGITPFYTLRETKPDEGFWDPAWGLAWAANDGDYHYDFYVPRGSIVQSYRLDNK